MKPTLKFGLAVLIAGVAVDAAAAGLPKDPCALLKPADIQVLAPSAKIGEGRADASMAPLGVGCTYTWGPKSNEWGTPSLSITVMDLSKAYAGTGIDTLKQGLQGKVKAGGPNAAMVPGVGDAAAFTFEARPSNAMAEALVKSKDLHLVLKHHAGDSLASKDKLIGLLKTAASRL